LRFLSDLLVDDSEAVVGAVTYKPPVLGRLCSERLLRLSELTRMSFVWLDRAYELRDGNLYIIKVNPLSNDVTPIFRSGLELERPPPTSVFVLI
jgi:hypothetical protein